MVRLAQEYPGTARELCALNHDQRQVPPGEYLTIFNDLCTAEALFYLATAGFNGRAYEEGRSVYAPPRHRRILPRGAGA